jgi:hypothetical protein
MYVRSHMQASIQKSHDVVRNHAAATVAELKTI